MKHFFLTIVAVAGLGGLGACDKPTGEDCRAAISNMQKLLGTDAATTVGRSGENEGEIRLCKGGSNRVAVACAKAANTLAELKACDFMSKPKK